MSAATSWIWTQAKPCQRGALIVGVFRSAVSLAGLDVLWQEFAIGVLIIVAVALDQWIRRVSK